MAKTKFEEPMFTDEVQHRSKIDPDCDLHVAFEMTACEDRITLNAYMFNRLEDAVLLAGRRPVISFPEFVDLTTFEIESKNIVQDFSPDSGFAFRVKRFQMKRRKGLYCEPVRVRGKQLRERRVSAQSEHEARLQVIWVDYMKASMPSV